MTEEEEDWNKIEIIYITGNNGYNEKGAGEREKPQNFAIFFTLQLTFLRSINLDIDYWCHKE